MCDCNVDEGEVALLTDEKQGEVALDEGLFKSLLPTVNKLHQLRIETLEKTEQINQLKELIWGLIYQSHPELKDKTCRLDYDRGVVKVVGDEDAVDDVLQRLRDKISKGA
jgi:hypothetical protein